MLDPVGLTDANMRRISYYGEVKHVYSNRLAENMYPLD